MGLELTLRGEGESHGFGIDVNGGRGSLMGLGWTLRGEGESHGFGIDVKGGGEVSWAWD